MVDVPILRRTVAHDQDVGCLLLEDHPARPGPRAISGIQVLPLEKRSVRLGNRWLKPTTEAMLTSGVMPPGWIGHLFDWT